MPQSFLWVPCKKAKELSDSEVIRPLQNFLNSQFVQASGVKSDYSKEIRDFNSLRTRTVCKETDSNPEALNQLYRYYDQFCAVESRFPLTETDIRLNFTWKDAFDKGSLFGKMKTTICTGQFERTCIMYNIGALASQVASSQSMDSDEGIKNAAKYFQISTWVFGYLKDNISSLLGQPATPDLTSDILNALSKVMLAQAQEAILKKTIKDKMKDGTVAKVAQCAGELYGEAHSSCQSSSTKMLLDQQDQEWLPVLGGKNSELLGVAEWHMALLAKEKKNVGEELARLTHATELLAAAKTRSSSAVVNEDLVGRVKRALDAAKKDNDFIYHEPVPDYHKLATIGSAALAKPVALAIGSPISENFRDIFDSLVPLAVHQSLTNYESRRTQLVNLEVGKLREQTQLLNGALASLNLPAAIEDTSGGSLPPSLLQKGAKVKELGGIQAIERLFYELPELLDRNKEILVEADRILAEEKESDDVMRTQFGGKWSRVASEKLTGPLIAESGKYHGILDNAMKADEIVRGKYGDNREAIAVLSKPDSEMSGSIPSGGVAAVAESDNVRTLRQLMASLDGLKRKRDALETELRETAGATDMKTAFLAALSHDGVIDEDAISVNELKAVYEPLQQKVGESVREQDEVMERVNEANRRFAEEKRGAGADEREEMLKKLAVAFDVYSELTGNLQEGIKFYNDLTQLLLKFQNKVKDFCFARKTEKDELMKEIQRNVVNQPTKPAPPRPAPRSSQPPAAQTPAAPTQPAYRPPAPTQPGYGATTTQPGYANAPPSSQYPGYQPAGPGFNPYPQQQYGAPPIQPPYHHQQPYQQPAYPQQPGYVQQAPPYGQSQYPAQPPPQTYPGYQYPQGTYQGQHYPGSGPPGGPQYRP